MPRSTLQDEHSSICEPEASVHETVYVTRNVALNRYATSGGAVVELG